MRILTIIAAIINFSVVAAQQVIDMSSFSVVYIYKINTFDDSGISVTDSMKIVTMVGQNITLSAPYSVYMKLKNENIELEEAYYEAIMHYPTILINYPSGYVTERETIIPHEYEAKGEKLNMNWSLIEEDTISIHGYFCKKARLSYGQKEWFVYYTEEIPASFGPWKFYGLPGMIVKAYDKEGSSLFEIREVIKESLPILYEKASISKTTTQKKFIRYKNKIYRNKQYVKKPLYYTSYGPSTAKSVTVIQSKNQIWLDGNLMLQKSHVYQPLEY